MNDSTHFQPPAEGDHDAIRELAHLHAAQNIMETEAFQRWRVNAAAVDLAVFAEESDAIAELSLAMIEPVEAPELGFDLGSLKREFASGFEHVPAGAGEWKELPGGKARIKEFSNADEDGFTTIMLEIDAGGRVPSHSHHGAEHVYLLSGDLFSDGSPLAAGDFLRAAPETRHGDLYSVNGCTALITTAIENHPRRAISLYDKMVKGLRRMTGRARSGVSLPR